jgi:hypothetical protein
LTSLSGCSYADQQIGNNPPGAKMASVVTFFRNTPAPTLKAYFDVAGIALPAYVAWDADEPDLVRPLLRAVDEMDAAARDRVVSDANRVNAMADEAGRSAFYAVIGERGPLDSLQNDHERALWVFLKDDMAFQQAEEVRFTDERRRGRSWDGFVGKPCHAVRRDSRSVGSFKAALGRHFNVAHVEVDIFERVRLTIGGEDCHLVQVTVYREGLPDDYKTFDKEGRLVRRARRPAYEAALTYEPSTGVIEAVAQDRATRKDLVGHFARHLLGMEFTGEKLPLKRYDLSVLLQPCDFQSDREDRIAGVELRLLRLMPIETTGQRITLECVNEPDATIWSMAEERLTGASLASGAYVPTQAKLVVRFDPEPGARYGRTLPLVITMPHGCNLKDGTEREQLIGEKYLRRWDLVIDDDVLIED